MKRTTFLASQGALLLAGCAGRMLPATVASQTNSALPAEAIVGEVHAVSGALPASWMPCDRRYLAVSGYRELFAVLGYSAGRRGAAFRLPTKQGSAIAVRGVFPSSPRVVEGVFARRMRRA